MTLNDIGQDQGGIFMAIDIKTIERIAGDYVAEVNKIFPIDKAYLYGSYAKGTQHDQSDVDICFFSSQFENKRTVDVLTDLLGITGKFPEVFIEPKAFPVSELSNDNPFVKEIIKTGHEIKIHQ